MPLLVSMVETTVIEAVSRTCDAYIGEIIRLTQSLLLKIVQGIDEERFLVYSIDVLIKPPFIDLTSKRYFTFGPSAGLSNACDWETFAHVGETHKVMEYLMQNKSDRKPAMSCLYSHKEDLFLSTDTHLKKAGGSQAMQIVV